MRPTRLLLVLLAILSSAGCEGPQGPEGRGLGSLDDPSVAPAVIYTYPPANSIGPYPGLERHPCGDEPCWYIAEILVRFNKFMDIPSVRRSVRLSSSSGELYADSNQIGCTGGDYFYIIPQGIDGYTYRLPFPVGEICTLQIGQGALDVNGNPLLPPYSMTFVPEPSFRVRGFYPPPGKPDVEPYWTRPILYFNSPVDSTIFPYIDITPPLAGTWTPYEGGRMLFLFGAQLDNSEQYTVRVRAGAPDTLGHMLPAPFTSTFGTVAFELVRFYLQYYGPRTDTINLDNSITAVFTAAVDSASAYRSIATSPPTPLRITQYENSVQIRPSLGWMASTSYTLRIDSSLESLTGGTLPRSYDYQFTTRPFLVRSSYPYDSSEYNPVNTNISIYTNAPLDTGTIRGAFRIEPTVPLSFQFYEGASSFSVRPVPEFKPQTWYTVTIDTTLRYQLGPGLTEDHVFRFRTW